jgi:hypothetical protein
MRQVFVIGCCDRLFVQVGAWLMHLFMVQVDYKLFRIGWCMVDALFYGTGLLQVEVQVDAWFRVIGIGCLVQVDWYRFTTVYIIVIV